MRQESSLKKVFQSLYRYLRKQFALFLNTKLTYLRCGMKNLNIQLGFVLPIYDNTVGYNVNTHLAV